MKKDPRVYLAQYEGVSIAEIWQIIERDLETLREAIIKILPPLEELERQIAGDDGRTD